MKVDFPQPESAASPMTIGVSPSFRAARADCPRRFEGVKLVKALAEARRAAAKMAFERAGEPDWKVVAQEAPRAPGVVS